MKKDKEFYRNITIYDDRDSSIRNWSSEIVKTKKEHFCFMCQKTIQKGTDMLRETGIDPDCGWVSAYTCGNCVDQFVE